MTVLKYFFLFFSFLFCIHAISACSYAYQYSLFPLGKNGETLLFLELELERYVNIPGLEINMMRSAEKNQNFETRWKGSVKIKGSADLNNFYILKNLASIDISDQRYKDELKPYFESAMTFVNTYPFFEEAYLLKTADCAYDRSCKMFQLEVDTTTEKLFCYLPELPQNKKIVSFPEILIKKYENITQLNFAEMDSVDREAKINFLKVWKPCSSRYYRIGDRTISVYCIGWGQKKGFTGTKDEDWKPNNLPVEQFIEGNLVLMHGQRFDSCAFTE